MYLLNAQQVRSYVQGPYGYYLDIGDFEEQMLQHTSYYFRLGNQYENRQVSGNQIYRLTAETPDLILAPGGYALVKTYETFFLSDKVMGIIGPTSGLLAAGVSLVHSPFIDPLFRGRLEVGLSNLTTKSITLRLAQIIGKVSFFDISDTYPVQIIPNSIAQKTFEQRRPQRDDDPVASWSEEDDSLS